jgi:hypothetical protein
MRLGLRDLWNDVVPIADDNQVVTELLKFVNEAERLKEAPDKVQGRCGAHIARGDHNC